MARTKRTPQPSASASSSTVPRVRLAGKGVMRADGTFVHLAHPTVSQKTPAHLFNYTGPAAGGQLGGKTYIPKLPKRKNRNRVTYTAPPLKGPKPVKRGAVAQHEVRHFQSTTDPAIPLEPFERLVREILGDYMDTPRIAPNAIVALRAATEAYMVHIFRVSHCLTYHGKRITLQPRDLKLYQELMKHDNFTRQ
ncbi:hypothetical protein D9756_002633 [Leucocoprinus leucothites]|uniref:Core Histone H2A/H2B/H3 domain-containing protein n=1 Tax=Leucocoprinus leucothites TaxID=201217 RepID=A0A8H5LMB0_9AGAR|nr:hypothetical protein D9756_002633 [Leucoagaricus leucothites]